MLYTSTPRLREITRPACEFEGGGCEALVCANDGEKYAESIENYMEIISLASFLQLVDQAAEFISH